MKKKLLLLMGVFLVVTCASSAFAVTLKRLGNHPFNPAMSTEADLRTMVEKNSADLQKGFVKAGNPELYTEFAAQFPNAQIEPVQIAPGQRMEWMLFRKNGKGPVMAVKDVTWGGETAFDAFKFNIDKDGQRYVFVVPAACGNLSLVSVEAVTAQAAAESQSPVCTMKLSNSEISCGQIITVDASGSTADGTIAEVVFQLLDASNAVVSEKIDKEAPFVQEFTIPCESSSYTVKAVVVDSNGAQSSSADCIQTVAVAQRKGGPVADVGLAYQFDPATYAFARVGYEYPLMEKLNIIGLVGGFVVLDDSNDDGDDSFTADLLLNYYLNQKMFVGGGAGLWSGHDGKVDLIVNMGYLVYEKLGAFKTSIFVEGRCQSDELVSSEATRLGIGLRFQF